MNLVMKRMEETKKIRMRIRERQLEDEERRIGHKAMEKEVQLDRIYKNKEWRERKRNSTKTLNSLRDQFLDDCISNRYINFLQ